MDTTTYSYIDLYDEDGIADVWVTATEDSQVESDLPDYM